MSQVESCRLSEVPTALMESMYQLWWQMSKIGSITIHLRVAQENGTEYADEIVPNLQLDGSWFGFKSVNSEVSYKLHLAQFEAAFWIQDQHQFVLLTGTPEGVK